jgi:hypothetical protein
LRDFHSTKVPVVQVCQYVDDVLTNGIEHTASPDDQYPTLGGNLQGHELIHTFWDQKVINIDGDNDNTLKLMTHSDDKTNVFQPTTHPGHQYPTLSIFDSGALLTQPYALQTYLPISLIQDPDPDDPDLGSAVAIRRGSL